MNNIAKAIAHAFCCEECRMCDDCSDNKKCWRLGKANALYNAHVKPLEDALAKSEADKAALVEALTDIHEEFLFTVGDHNCMPFTSSDDTRICVVLERIKEQS